jgi:hypothetical protein
MKTKSPILRICILMCIPLTCLACSEQKTQTVRMTEVDNIIRLSSAIENMRDVLLSEIADSISFIILETRNDCLLGGNPTFSFSPHFIYNYTYSFDWEGKFNRRIGRRGNGPCEDPAEQYYEVLFKDNHFYSKGMKLIEYDSNVRCTGKEQFVYGVDRENIQFSGLINATSFSIAGNNFMLFSHPDSILFLNKDFQFVASRQVLESFPPQTRYLNPIGRPFTTSYHDTTVFYNFFNDTIFHVIDIDIIPKWIVDLDNTKKIPIEYLSRQGELLSTAVRSGNLENSELVKISNNKIIVKSAYETNRHVFLLWSKIIPFAGPRNIEPAISQIAFYDKFTGKTTSVKGKGFTDDILGMEYFYPNCGAYVDKLIKSVWPFELQDFIDDCHSKGKKVNPKLLELSKKVKSDDNPILIVVHIKQQ